MKISFRSALWMVGFNLVLAFILGVIYQFNNQYDNNGWWEIPVVVLGLGVVMCIVCLFVVVIVRKQKYEPHIYFYGQLLVTLALIGVPAYFMGYGYMRDKKYGNIEYNKILLSSDPDKFKGQLMALEALQSNLPNKNDLRLEQVFTNCDTTITPPECLFHFIYTTKQTGDEHLTSKYIYGKYLQKLEYSGIPLAKNEELLKMKNDSEEEMRSVLKELKQYMDSAAKQQDE